VLSSVLNVMLTGGMDFSPFQDSVNITSMASGGMRSEKCDVHTKVSVACTLKMV